MTDARLAAAVEAAAEVDFLDVWSSSQCWADQTPETQGNFRQNVAPIVVAALAAADAWDREQRGGFREPRPVPR